MKQGINRLLGAKQLLHTITAQSTSMYANQVIAFVIPWLVLTRTGSAANAGFVAFAIGAAALAGTLVGGVLTDHLGGRKVSVISDLLSFTTALLLAIALFFDFFALWLVIVSQVIGVFFDGPGTVAKNALVPTTAKDGGVPLPRAMGLQMTLQNLTSFIGPVSAGILIAVLTESATLAITSVLFLVAIYFMARLPRRIMVHEHPMSISQATKDMKEAVVFIFQERLLRGLQIFGPLYAFVLLPASTLIYPAWYVFAGQSSAALGLFLGAEAVGAAIGGLLYAAFAPKVRRQQWVLAATTAAYAITLASLSFLQPGSIAAVAVAFLGGLSLAGIFTIPYTAFYVHTPERLLGRVGSFGAAAGFLVTAISALIFGWLISATSPQVALITCAIIMAAMCFGVIFLPFMKLLDKKPSNT